MSCLIRFGQGMLQSCRRIKSKLASLMVKIHQGRSLRPRDDVIDRVANGTSRR